MSRLRKYPMLAGLALAVSLLAGGLPSAAQGSLAMLSKLEKGSWELRSRDGTAPRRICVRSGGELIQLRHSGSCNRFVVEDGANLVTVQYTCRGNGYGRTSVRRESSTLVQIESQGIQGGEPFSFTAEARRTGPCT